MDAAQHLVTLNPQAVELVDATMIALARDIPMFRQTIEEFVDGTPEALLAWSNLPKKIQLQTGQA